MTPEHRTQILEFAVAEWNSRIRKGMGLAMTRRVRRCVEVMTVSNAALEQYQQNEAGGEVLSSERLIELWESHKTYLREQDNVAELTAADRYFEALYQYDQAIAEADHNDHHMIMARVERLENELRRVIREVEGLVEGLAEGQRWPVDGVPYQEALVQLHRRKFVVIVKGLHRFVVGKALEVLRLGQGRHVGTKQAQKIAEGLRRTNKNIKTQLAKMNEMARNRPELAHFRNTSLAAAAKPDGPFWAQYTAWLAGQGCLLLPHEVVVVRHLLLLKKSSRFCRLKYTGWASGHRLEWMHSGYVCDV